jgi:signal transduction histidine kinase
MTERVRALGGTCLVESASPNGTVIHVEIPIARAGTQVARRREFAGEMS